MTAGSIHITIILFAENLRQQPVSILQHSPIPITLPIYSLQKIMYCRLSFRHLTLTFPSRPRTLRVLPISSRQLFVLFKDFSYISYDITTSTLTHEGKLPQLVKPDNYLALDSNNLIFIYPKSVYIYNCRLNTFTKYSIDIDKSFRKLIYFPESQSIAVIIQKTHLQPVQLIHYFLKEPEKFQKIELNSNFKQPYLLKTSPNSYVIVDFSQPNFHVKEMTILLQQLDIAEIVYSQTPLDISAILGCFYSKSGLDIFAMKKDKVLFMQYDYSSNTLSQQISILKDNILVYEVPGLMLDNYSLRYTQVTNLQSYFAVISKEGRVIDQIKVQTKTQSKLKDFSIESSMLALDGTSFFQFIHCNQKCMEKVKTQVPTTVKFNQYKVIGKDKIYFQMLKQVHQFGGESLWRRVLNVLG